MKAIISTTYDDKYLWNLPLVTWCWNKLGVDVICFAPMEGSDSDYAKMSLALGYCKGLSISRFIAPKHKEATYAQCSRLYAACLDLPEDGVLITSDVDMAMFKVPPYIDKVTIFGSDLVPDGQFPMCYASATVKEWRSTMKLNGKTYQQCLDELLGHIEAEHFRGNYWGKDQQTLWENTKDNATLYPRSNGQNQFATKRYDRDDAYILDRLSPDTIDFHMNRPGYEDANFEIILKILQYHYPNDGFDWLADYNNAYKQLL